MEPWLRSQSHPAWAVAAERLEQAELTIHHESRLQFRPTEADEPYSDWLVVAGTQFGTGCCACPHQGHRGRQTDNPCLSIALLDAVLDGVDGPMPLVARNVLEGTPDIKAEGRANLLAERISALSSKAERSVALVGYVGSIVQRFEADGWRVLVTEMDESLVGVPTASGSVANSTSTVDHIAAADVAVVTGMVLSTNTLGSVREAATAGGTPMVFFAQTGGNILRCTTFGTPTYVMHEAFPHYMWPGQSVVNCYSTEGESP